MKVFTVTNQDNAVAKQYTQMFTTDTRRLFFADRFSKYQFLVDMGSDLCVHPGGLIPRRKERRNYYHCAVNGTTIPTYGWLPLSLNMGLCRNFTWHFVVANATRPLFRNDLLPRFGLLVDCKRNRLLGLQSSSVLFPRGTRTTPTCSLRQISGVRYPHQPG